MITVFPWTAWCVTLTIKCVADVATIVVLAHGLHNETFLLVSPHHGGAIMLARVVELVGDLIHLVALVETTEIAVQRRENYLRMF